MPKINQKRFKTLFPLVAIISLIAITLIYENNIRTRERTDYEELLYAPTIYNPIQLNVKAVLWTPTNDGKISVTLNYTQIENDFQAIKEKGFNIVRFWVIWTWLDEYNPSLTTDDQRVKDFIALIVNTAQKQNLKLIPVLIEDNIFDMLSHNIEYLKQWITAIVSPYIGNEIIYAWDVINEPRNASNPKIRELCTYIKTIDPTHKVTVGFIGLPPEGSVDFVDIVSGHWYPYTIWEDKRPYDTFAQFLEDMNTLSKGKPFLVSEIGIMSGKHRFQGKEISVNETAQMYFAYGALDLMKKAKDAGLNILGYCWAAFKDYDVRRIILGRDTTLWTWGLQRINGTWKPAINAFP